MTPLASKVEMTVSVRVGASRRRLGDHGTGTEGRRAEGEARARKE